MSHPSLMSFDYALKYFLKDTGDYSIIEGFLSALLKTQGYKEVKIVALLEIEGDKEDPQSKRSLADLVVEDQDGHKYIVEIERCLIEIALEDKACFNTSRLLRPINNRNDVLIVDKLSSQSPYTDITKVFHIMLLYFPIKDESSMYYGKTITYEREPQKKLTIRMKNVTASGAKQEEQTGAAYEATDVVPEYFIISIPGFDDHVKQEIDEWLYVMKHKEVRSDFQSPAMKQVAERLNFFKMTPGERNDYYSYHKNVCDDKEVLKAAVAKGTAEGIMKGKEEGWIEGMVKIALSMLKDSVDMVVISKYTGLPLWEIKKLKDAL